MDNLEQLVGRELVGFNLVRLLGEGGMAAVFLGENALDPTITRAIKVVRPELSGRKEFLTRFAEEARILERLQHPNIVGFYGVRRDQGFLVMELEMLSGCTVGEEQQARVGSHLPVDEVARWIAQAAQGVAVAHKMGVVHRDLKPDNLFLDKSGAIKVLDFGIARALDEADRRTKATAAGKVPGTPAYMAPEVCEGATPGPGADVYALGMTLYELLLGFHPFLPPGEPPLSGIQLMFAHIQRQLPSIREARPDVSEVLEQIILRSMAQDPTQRYPSARELADALNGVVAQAGGGAGSGKAGMTRLDLPTFQSGASARSGAFTASSTGTPAGGGSRSTAGVTIRSGSDYETSAPEEKKSRAPLIAAALIVLGGAGAGGWYYTQEEPPPPELVEEGPKALENPWITVEPPRHISSRDPVLLGRGASKQPIGFHPDKGITPPTYAYQLQQHEVSFGELELWLEDRPDRAYPVPSTVPDDADARWDLPAVGVPWEVAQAYCKTLGANLPTEEEWEFAARGKELRPYPWGSQPLDLNRTNTLKGPGGRVQAVMLTGQDYTPGPESQRIYDLVGNAREWTLDLYRENLPKEMHCRGKGRRCLDAYEQGVSVPDIGLSIRVVRGMVLNKPAPDPLPDVGSAFRYSLCATGPCTAKLGSALEDVGFRCARPAPDEEK